MHFLILGGRAICVGLAAALLAGCGSHTNSLLPNQLPVGADVRPSVGNGYKILHAFRGGSDGWLPEAKLLAANGELYGTTISGGSSSTSQCFDGCGTIFKMSLNGTLRVVHSFTGDPTDGASPYAGLTELNGIFYGTTCCGGANGRGTVYKMAADGKEALLYSFGGFDGAWPSADLTIVKGALYGTTRYGGTSRLPCSTNEGCGNVFEVSTSGKERSVYSFQGSLPQEDGFWPYARLVFMNGALYGTTSQGGEYRGGAIFKVTTAGMEHVIYNFDGRHYGFSPIGGLTQINGELYGTTLGGGAYGFGTVFKISASGKEQLIYTFKGYPADGA